MTEKKKDGHMLLIQFDQEQHEWLRMQAAKRTLESRTACSMSQIIRECVVDAIKSQQVSESN
jgi:hypothetical protein